MTSSQVEAVVALDQEVKGLIDGVNKDIAGFDEALGETLRYVNVKTQLIMRDSKKLATSMQQLLSVWAFLEENRLTK
jgi:hypothetical protein